MTFNPVRVAIGATVTAEGFLVFRGERLLGVIARLDGAHYGELEGRFHIEANFTPFGGASPVTFESLDQAAPWFEG